VKRLLVAIALLCSLTAPLFAVPAYAYNPFDNACGTIGGGGGSTACGTDGSDPISGKNGVLVKASLVVATIAGVAAVIIIIISGFRYITANGDMQKVASARNALVGSLIGIAIIVSAESLVIFVIKGL
jgi:hypothetical protein